MRHNFNFEPSPGALRDCSRSSAGCPAHFTFYIDIDLKYAYWVKIKFIRMVLFLFFFRRNATTRPSLPSPSCRQPPPTYPSPSPLPTRLITQPGPVSHRAPSGGGGANPPHLPLSTLTPRRLCGASPCARPGLLSEVLWRLLPRAKGASKGSSGAVDSG